MSATESITAREFVALFDEGWHAPGSAEGLLAYFEPYLDPAVHMSGPLSPDCQGIHQVTEFFGLLFAVIPDLHGGVEDFEVESEEVVRMRVRLRGTVGCHPVELNLRDRVIVRDGKMVDRAARGLPRRRHACDPAHAARVAPRRQAAGARQVVGAGGSLRKARIRAASASGCSSGMNVRESAISSKRPWGRSSASRCPCSRGKILSPSAHRTSAGLSKPRSDSAASNV